MKEKYDTELEFSNDEITMHKNKFNKLRDEYSSKEEETIVLSAVVKTKEAQLSEMQKVKLMHAIIKFIYGILSETYFRNLVIVSNNFMLGERTS